LRLDVHVNLSASGVSAFASAIGTKNRNFVWAIVNRLVKEGKVRISRKPSGYSGTSSRKRVFHQGPQSGQPRGVAAGASANIKDESRLLQEAR
jgi:hypothetical protein